MADEITPGTSMETTRSQKGRLYRIKVTYLGKIKRKKSKKKARRYK